MKKRLSFILVAATICLLAAVAFADLTGTFKGEVVGVMDGDTGEPGTREPSEPLGSGRLSCLSRAWSRGRPCLS
ncbi:MAG: hypothetical protein P1S46_12375 [bacterium]|nr:hypothetical protein [bacterium]